MTPPHLFLMTGGRPPAAPAPGLARRVLAALLAALALAVIAIAVLRHG